MMCVLFVFVLILTTICIPRMKKEKQRMDIFFEVSLDEILTPQETQFNVVLA